METLNKKIISNAVSTYLLIFVSGLFLFNKSDKNIAHPFVRNHAKSAFFIHTLFLINYIVSIVSGIFDGVTLLSLPLGRIIFTLLSLLLLIKLIYGMYLAHN